MLAAALAATMFAGCGKGSDDSAKDTKPQESQDVAATENIEETENGAETESQKPQPQYPEIVSDGKVKSYQSVVTVDDAAYAEVSKGIATVSLSSGLPVLFGVLTTDNIEQAIERAGTKAGNKGYDVAVSAIEMVNLFKNL